MLNDDTRSWTGVRLLQHLMNRIEPDAAHLPLNLHTMYALIASRPSLLSGRPAVHASLAGLQYALRIADR